MNILDRVKRILLNPNQEWEIIKGEETNNQSLITQYALPLIIAGGITAVIGNFLNDYSIGYIISSGVISIVVQLILLLVASYIIYILADSFGSKKDLNSAMKLVIYSNTAAMVAAVVSNFSPILAWIGLFGLYGIYLFWTGLSKIMETPEEKKLVFTIVAAILVFFTTAISGIIITTIIGILSFLY
ncbi:MAG: YIP1 family protein [Cyclobacteriaceae bacterium]|nr:YIP1 family protein [Cyclobacteriaceae bacterium]